MLEQDYLELLELQQIIREGVEEAVPGPVRVRAEVASVQQRANGHCYLELCQSDERAMLAKARAIIWRNKADILLNKFAAATGAPLQPGISVIFEVNVNYSELYGVSLIIDDIDLSTTLGEAELLKRQTLDRLKKEGLLELQKEFALPVLPYRLAVISAPDAAGYGDFRRHLLENEYGFAFSVTLFEATMQGAGAPDSIIAALDRIVSSSLQPNETQERSDSGDSCKAAEGGTPPSPLGVQGDIIESKRRSSFDSILILRGGGSTLDLACFDDYALCAAIARCPIPVCTAIGHDRDEHAADLVASISVKTPTALADLFIDTVAAEDERISSYQSRLKLAFSSKLAAQTAAADKLQHRIHFALNHLLMAADASLSKLETRITAANPRKLLDRGYTLVAHRRGALVRRAADTTPGDELSVLFPDGTVDCTVRSVNINPHSK